MDFDLLNRRRDKFMLWAPAQTQSGPQLVIGTIVVSQNPDVPSTVNEFFTGPFVKSDQPDLWELDPKSIQPKPYIFQNNMQFGGLAVRKTCLWHSNSDCSGNTV